MASHLPSTTAYLFGNLNITKIISDFQLRYVCFLWNVCNVLPLKYFCWGLILLIKSFRPGGAYMIYWTVSSLVQVIANQLFEPIMTCCKLNPCGQSSGKFESKYKYLVSKKCTSGYCLQNGSHIVSDSNVLLIKIACRKNIMSPVFVVLTNYCLAMNVWNLLFNITSDAYLHCVEKKKGFQLFIHTLFLFHCIQSTIC